MICLSVAAADNKELSFLSQLYGVNLFLTLRNCSASREAGIFHLHKVSCCILHGELSRNISILVSSLCQVDSTNREKKQQKWTLFCFQNYISVTRSRRSHTV